jgi:hypothetical protein
MGKSADALASTLACTTAADASVNYSKYVPQRPQNFPLPRWDFHIWLALVLAGWRCLRPGWYGDFVIMHHQWKQSFHCAALIFKSSHRPDGKVADALALILACATATDALVNYRGCVLQRP